MYILRERWREERGKCGYDLDLVLLLVYMIWVGGVLVGSWGGGWVYKFGCMCYG